VAAVLEEMVAEPHDGPTRPPETFCRLIDQLMSPADRLNEGPDRPRALAQLNAILGREGFEAFYGEDNHCHLRHVGSNTVTVLAANPHRPFSKAEQERRQLLAAYLDQCSEDDLIEEVLLPLFRQLGYHRITAAGHKDKALEYGKDIWMRYTLPTQHLLYFGIQAKKGKIDASGVTKASNANVAEIHHQVLMMLAHEIFDPETNKRVLVDHAFIVAGGDITKAARNWIGNALDDAKRSQIMFMDPGDIPNAQIFKPENGVGRGHEMPPASYGCSKSLAHGQQEMFVVDQEGGLSASLGTSSRSSCERTRSAQPAIILRNSRALFERLPMKYSRPDPRASFRSRSWTAGRPLNASTISRESVA
jgi:hypothetical protein